MINRESVEDYVVQNQETETYLRDINDTHGIKSCYDACGVVGITGVLTKTELRETVDEYQRVLLEMGVDKRLNIRDSSTYDLASTSCNRYGVIGINLIPRIFHQVCT